LAPALPADLPPAAAGTPARDDSPGAAGNTSPAPGLGPTAPSTGPATAAGGAIAGSNDAGSDSAPALDGVARDASNRASPVGLPTDARSARNNDVSDRSAGGVANAAANAANAANAGTVGTVGTVGTPQAALALVRWHLDALDFEGASRVLFDFDTFGRAPDPLLTGQAVDALRTGGLRAAGKAAAASDAQVDERLVVEIDSAQSSAIVVGAGAAWWGLRLAGIAAALAASTPVWRAFDPIPILGARDGEREGGAGSDDADGPDGIEAQERDRDEDASRELLDQLRHGAGAASAAAHRSSP
jgi:hypothetical protein